jgi:hypothetical protein
MPNVKEKLEIYQLTMPNDSLFARNGLFKNLEKRKETIKKTQDQELEKDKEKFVTFYQSQIEQIQTKGREVKERFSLSPSPNADIMNLSRNSFRKCQTKTNTNVRDSSNKYIYSKDYFRKQFRHLREAGSRRGSSIEHESYKNSIKSNNHKSPLCSSIVDDNFNQVDGTCITGFSLESNDKIKKGDDDGDNVLYKSARITAVTSKSKLQSKHAKNLMNHMQ